jgi:biopolymer transport protein ExbB
MLDLFREGGWTLGAIVGLSVVGWTIVVVAWLRLRSAQRDGGTGLLGVARGHHGNERGGFDVLGPARYGSSGRTGADAEQAGGRSARPFDTRVAPLIAGQRVRLVQPLPLVAVIAGLCPLLGLLGTVLGMMTTFHGVTAGGTVRPDALAQGIGQALVTTQAGLVMALPLFLMHGYLTARADRLVDELALRLRKAAAGRA